MSQNLPFDLFSHNYNIQEVYNKQDGEMIGYFFLSQAGTVAVEDLQLVPITDKSDNNLSCSSQNATSEDSKDIEVKKEITDQGNKEGDVNISNIKTFIKDEPSAKPSITTHNSVMLIPPQKAPGSEIPPDLIPLMKPASEGWKRECVMKAGKVTKVYYLSPPDKEGLSKRLSFIKSCMDHLGPNSELSYENFQFGYRALGLPPDFEIIRESLHQPSARTKTFTDYFIECDRNTAKGKRLVECKLCSQRVSYSTFSIHMRKYHLPDETCPTCGVELPPLQMLNHTRTTHMSSIRGGIYNYTQYRKKGEYPKSRQKVLDYVVKFDKSSSQVIPSTTEVEVKSSTSNIPDQKNIERSSKETLSLNSNSNKETTVSSPAMLDLALNESSLSLVTTNAVDKLSENNSVTENVPSEKEKHINIDSGTIEDVNLSKPANKNVQNVSPKSAICLPSTDNIVLTFVYSNLRVKKRLQIAGDKPVSKAVNMFSKAMSLSTEDFTFNCNNSPLTGTELIDKLPSFVIVMEKK